MRPLPFTAPGPGARARALAAILLFACAAPAAADDADAKPHKISAKYELLFGGARIARFYFDGDVGQASYDVKGRARASTFGKLVLDFKGWTKAEGSVSANALSPRSYELKVVSSHARTTQMTFDGGGVGKLAIEPPVRGKSSRVPLTAAHRKNVLDPMSAAMIPLPAGKLTGKTACGTRLPIFTGRERFDLILSFKRTESIPALGGGKGKTDAYVCKVKYEPIAGHRKKREETEFMSSTDDIEIWLAPVPETGMFIPYRAVLPTPVGTATLGLEHFSVSTPGDRAGAEQK